MIENKITIMRLIWNEFVKEGFMCIIQLESICGRYRKKGFIHNCLNCSDKYGMFTAEFDHIFSKITNDMARNIKFRVTKIEGFKRSLEIVEKRFELFVDGEDVFYEKTL